MLYDGQSYVDFRRPHFGVNLSHMNNEQKSDAS